jgi:hypothetical protein
MSRTTELPATIPDAVGFKPPEEGIGTIVAERDG